MKTLVKVGIGEEYHCDVCGEFGGHLSTNFREHFFKFKCGRRRCTHCEQVKFICSYCKDQGGDLWADVYDPSLMAVLGFPRDAWFCWECEEELNLNN